MPERSGWRRNCCWWTRRAVRDGPAGGLDSRYREIIERQLVSSLQIHLAFGDADRTLIDDPPVDHLRSLGPQRVVPWLAEVFSG